MSKPRRKKRMKIGNREFVEVRNWWPKSMRHSDTYWRSLPRERRPLSKEQRKARKTDAEVIRYIRNRIRESGELQDRKSINLAVKRVIEGPSIRKLENDLQAGLIKPPSKAKEMLDKIIDESIDFVSYPRA